MKEKMTKVFWPILKFFEGGESKAHYKKSHRTALKGVGALFLLLSLISALAAKALGGLGGLVPVVIFLCVGAVAIIVAVLGSDQAVAKIWGSK